MSPNELGEFATRYTAAWCSHDADAVASFFAEDGSITVNDGDRAVGRVALAKVFQGFFDAFPDTVVLMDHVRGAGRRAIYSWIRRDQHRAWWNRQRRSIQRMGSVDV
jgi:uncharacterized protein (TIGR02246 family)